MALSGLLFRKMNGCGNDFVVVDLRRAPARMTADAARRIADRAGGIGCDQVITIEERDGPFMGVWNADGSQAGACGNAARCVAALLMEESGEDGVAFDTLSGPISAERVGTGRVAVDMGVPKFHWREIPLAEEIQDTRFVDIKLGPIDKPALWGPSAVNMGNPHCVFFVDDAEAQALDRFGPMIENHPLFPERANVSVAEVRGRQYLRLRVWERGVGVTKACGSAACAAVVAANRRRLIERKASVELDGGLLAVEWRADDHVILTGPYEREFEGLLPGGL
jgi:diaminopimelate epimerase